MRTSLETAVEITRGEDFIELWVDANNNGVRDDDDVNIFITAGGGFHTVSPTFKHALDTLLQARIKELALALLSNGQPTPDQHAEENKLRNLALQLVIRATQDS